MQFEKGYIYHIYNQGNNRQKIFFNRENYLFFLKKINNYILPYGDILSWCLMPNHFHLMVLVRDVEVSVITQQMTQSHQMSNYKHQTSNQSKERTITNSIAIMLRSYTRAINKQENLSGSLFRQHTKTECINCPNRISPSFITKNGITEIKISNPEKEYPQVCFNYIHQNPVKAKLVKRAEDWEFSSAVDYAGLRGGRLVNKEVAGEYVQV